MKTRTPACLLVLCLSLALAGSAYAGPPRSGARAAQTDTAAYALANECHTLRSRARGALVAKADGGGYRTSGSSVADSEHFRMQATALGRFMFFGHLGDYMAGGADNRVTSASGPSERADWQVESVGSGMFRITLPSSGKALAVSGDGDLVLVDPGAAGEAGLFSFEPGGGCASYPEVQLNVSGKPRRGSTSHTEVAGMLDAHMHMMAFEFLGGRAHCGRPWHPYGAPYALEDCPDHYSRAGPGNVLDNVTYGDPARTHDPVGWPTFKDWPHHKSLVHEQTYYKWVERAWLGGLRVFVNLLVENRVLCEIYPLKQNSCDEMDSVRLQARRMRELESYIDAQNGGPGKGWFRIVTSPFEARRVINDGKLAVVMGIEVSEPFGCIVYNDEPKCDKARIDRELDEVYGFGVRQMELINKYDNALAGVAGDDGTNGAATNSGNKYSTGKYWDMERCTGPPEEADKDPLGAPDHNDDAVIGNGLQALAPLGGAPSYPSGPLCNRRGLTDLGEHAVRRLMEKRINIDPDHLSVKARKSLMSIVEAARYPGIMSSHSWSTPDVVPRIYNLGGVIAPAAGEHPGAFVKEWRENKPKRNPKYYYGLGYGADQNGFAAQPEPRHGSTPGSEVAYPFKSFDGSVTIDRNRSGDRVWDINSDGVAHYGLYPDWVEDQRMQAGNQIVEDLARGAEAYLQMWERTVGVPEESCRSSRARFSRRGLAQIRLGSSPEQLLRRASQPRQRQGRVWRYCVARAGASAKKKKRRKKAVTGRVMAVFTRDEKVGLVVSTGTGHKAGRVGRGAKASRLRGRAKRFGRGFLVRRAGRGARVFYRVRRGRVRYVAVASRSAVKSRKSLRIYLRLAGLR